MMTLAQRARRGDRGAVAVEFALIIPLLLLLLMGVIDFGRAMYVKSTLVYTASQGARVASMRNANWQTVVNTTASSLQVQKLAGNSAVTAPTSTSTAACPADAATSPDTATVSVTVSVPFKWLTPVGWLPAAGAINTLSATSTWICVKTKFS